MKLEGTPRWAIRSLLRLISWFAPSFVFLNSIHSRGLPLSGFFIFVPRLKRQAYMQYLQHVLDVHSHMCHLCRDVIGQRTSTNQTLAKQCMIAWDPSPLPSSFPRAVLCSQHSQPKGTGVRFHVGVCLKLHGVQDRPFRVFWWVAQNLSLVPMPVNPSLRHGQPAICLSWFLRSM